MPTLPKPLSIDGTTPSRLSPAVDPVLRSRQPGPLPSSSVSSEIPLGFLRSICVAWAGPRSGHLSWSPLLLLVNPRWSLAEFRLCRSLELQWTSPAQAEIESQSKVLWRSVQSRALVQKSAYCLLHPPVQSIQFAAVALLMYLAPHAVAAQEHDEEPPVDHLSLSPHSLASPALWHLPAFEPLA